MESLLFILVSESTTIMGSGRVLSIRLGLRSVCGVEVKNRSVITEANPIPVSADIQKSVRNAGKGTIES